MLEENAVEVPEDLDPAAVVGLVLTYMTAYQLLHRMANVKSGESVLVHGAAGRVGSAVLELGAIAGCRLYGTASVEDAAAVERLGAVAIDYRNEDFVARVRALPEKGVDVVLDGLGGALSLRSFRALRSGGRLVVFGHSSTIADGHRSWRGWIEWYSMTAAVALWGLVSPGKRVMAYRIQKLREGHQWVPAGSRHPLAVGGGPRDTEWFREDFAVLLELLSADKIHPVVVERLPLSEARRRARDAGELGVQGEARARALMAGYLPIAEHGDDSRDEHAEDDQQPGAPPSCRPPPHTRLACQHHRRASQTPSGSCRAPLTSRAEGPSPNDGECAPSAHHRGSACRRGAPGVYTAYTLGVRSEHECSPRTRETKD